MVNDHSLPPVPQNCPEALLLDPNVERRPRRFFEFSSARRRLVIAFGVFLLLAVVGSFSMNHSKEAPKTPDISSEELKRLQKQSFKALYNDLLESYHQHVRLPIHRLSVALEPLSGEQNLTEVERLEAEGSCGTIQPRRIAFALKEVEKFCNGSHLNKDVFEFLHQFISYSFLTNSENNRARELFTRLYFFLEAPGSREQIQFSKNWESYKGYDLGSTEMNSTLMLETLYRDVRAGRRISNQKEEVQTQCLPLAVYVGSGFKGNLLIQLRDEIVDHIEELKRLTIICSKTDANIRDEYIYKMTVIWELASVDHFIKGFTQSLLHETWPEIETHFASAILSEKFPIGRKLEWDNATLTKMAVEVYRGLKEIGHPDFDHQVVILPSNRDIESLEASPEAPNFYCLPNHCSIIYVGVVKMILIRQEPMDEERRRHLNNFAHQVDEVFKNSYEKDGFPLNVTLPQMEAKYRVRFSEFERHSMVYFLFDHGFESIDDATFGVAGEEKSPPAFRTVGFDNNGTSSYNVHWSFLIF